MKHECFDKAGMHLDSSQTFRDPLYEGATVRSV
jgi:hypothetical protein